MNKKPGIGAGEGADDKIEAIIQGNTDADDKIYSAFILFFLYIFS
ncbi:hypothetical protein [Rahnella sikkimica]|nr:hypothetical protein [Rahnella sikkimica]